MHTVAIIGASGYSGQEVLDRVLGHPGLEVVALGSDSLAGSPAAALDVRLNGSLPEFVRNDEALEVGADVVFVCLGHERAAGLEPPAGTVVVDLSGGHRLREPALYRAWYGFEHPRPESLDEWCYSVPEVAPPAGPLVANPGCYATAALLALAPLAGVVDPEHVVVDAKSGVSGAGREPEPSSHAGFVLENVSAYRVGRHQHAPEIAQLLGFPVTFVPHVVPVRRGLLATCYVNCQQPVRALLQEAYADSAVVRVLPDGVAPELARVQHTDGAEIGVFEDLATGSTIIACALDNLGKGAAGQALQNANLALGLDETAGLRLAGVFV
jgi:N-acetyl-gamma-glutamyl-phosphate reductase